MVSALGNELLVTNLDATGALMTVLGSASGVTLKDEVWVTGSDQHTERIVGEFVLLLFLLSCFLMHD